MTLLTITRGLPASGKTTWAREECAATGAARVNRDDLRAMTYGRHAGLTWAEETAITDASHAVAAAHLRAGRDVVVDETNLRPKYVRRWMRLADKHGADIAVIDFPTPVDVCIERDAARDRVSGAGVIRRMAEKYMPGGVFLPIPAPDDGEAGGEPYEPLPGSTFAVMVDIDGTLAERGDRSPYDWSRVGEDTPIPAVVEAVQAARALGNRIVFCSGRSDECRADTEAWLTEQAGLEPDDLVLMRGAGDNRRDSVVKLELFNQHIRDQYNVRYVLDDRQQVVDAWRSIGLTVFQVAPGDF